MLDQIRQIGHSQLPKSILVLSSNDMTFVQDILKFLNESGETKTENHIESHWNPDKIVRVVHGQSPVVML
jgi:spore coat protein CotH